MSTFFPSESDIRAKISKLILCPISKKIMSDPVLAEDGITYDRSSVEQYLAEGGDDSLRDILSRGVITNSAVKTLIDLLKPSDAQHKEVTRRSLEDDWPAYLSHVIRV